MDEDSTLLRLTGGDVNRLRGDDDSSTLLRLTGDRLLLRFLGGDANRDDRIRRGDNFWGVMYVFLILSISFRRLLCFLPLDVLPEEDLLPCIES